MSFEVLRERTIGQGVFLQLSSVTLGTPEGDEIERDVIRHPGGVGILPIDGDHILLVEQFRVAIGRKVAEIPAGKLDPDDHDAEDAARRELQEEIGHDPVRLVDLGSMLPSPGYTDEVIHLYAADGIVPAAGDRRPDGAEERHARVIRITLSEASEMIQDGRLTDAKTQIALLRWMTLRRSR